MNTLLAEANATPEIPPRSHPNSLRVHAEVIRVLRAKNYSYEQIARWLRHRAIPATKGQVVHALRKYAPGSGKKERITSAAA